jgi:hypothetical protein
MVLPQAADAGWATGTGEGMLLVGDDWAEDHHDVELMDPGGPDAGPGPAARGGGGDGPAARDDR